MSTTTPNIGLFKYDTAVDGQSTFNINQSLNQNWDIVDMEVGQIKNKFDITPIILSASGTVPLENQNVYFITPIHNIILALPDMQDKQFGQILVVLQMNEAYRVTLDTDLNFIGVNGDVETITTGKYTLYFEYSSLDARWTVGIIKKEEVED